MKRFHIHVEVKSIEESVKFYSTLFGQKPSKLKEDYAKWMLDEPRLNFAISTRASTSGVDRLGIQVDEDSELSELTERLKKADLKLFGEGERLVAMPSLRRLGYKMLLGLHGKPIARWQMWRSSMKKAT